MQEKDSIDRHPMITLGLLTAGTQLGSALIQKLGKHPTILFAMGASTGIYAYIHRKEIVAEAEHLKQQSKALLFKIT